jgi:hypothetical protein
MFPFSVSLPASPLSTLTLKLILQIGAEDVGNVAVDAVAIGGRAALRDLVAAIVHIIAVVAGAAGHAVGALAADEVVVAAVARQRVVAVLAVERVAVVIADNLVGQRVAGAGAVGAARQRQVLDEVAEREGERTVDLLGALAGEFDDHVLVAVDLVGVVAGAAGHGVGADPAVELVGAAVADQQVVGVVAGGVERAGAGQGDVLDAVIDGTVEVDRDRCLHAIVGIAAGLDDHVMRAIHHIEIVADAAVKRVGARAAVERVVAEAAAGDRVVAGQPVEQVGKAGADEGVVERRAVECGHDLPAASMMHP